MVSLKSYLLSQNICMERSQTVTELWLLHWLLWSVTTGTLENGLHALQNYRVAWSNGQMRNCSQMVCMHELSSWLQPETNVVCCVSVQVCAEWHLAVRLVRYGMLSTFIRLCRRCSPQLGAENFFQLVQWAEFTMRALWQFQFCVVVVVINI